MKDLTKGQPLDVPIPCAHRLHAAARRSWTTPEKANEFAKENKEQAAADQGVNGVERQRVSDAGQRIDGELA